MQYDSIRFESSPRLLYQPKQRQIYCAWVSNPSHCCCLKPLLLGADCLKLMSVPQKNVLRVLVYYYCAWYVFLQYRRQHFQQDGTVQLFGTMGQKILQCPRTKGQRDKCQFELMIIILANTFIRKGRQDIFSNGGSSAVTPL